MPRYYFNLDDTDHVSDPDGTELRDDTDAMAHATLVMRELMFQRAGMLGELWAAWTMRVSDTDGRTIHLIPFAQIPLGPTN
jgi:Domain of unknown function (DUF6894)